LETLAKVESATFRLVNFISLSFFPCLVSLLSVYRLEFGSSSV